jgi:DNA-binding IscR family transcriptional regulator
MAPVESLDTCYRKKFYIHDKLMSAGDQFEIISVVELLWDILTEGVTSTSRRNTPACAIIRIWPQKVAHRALMRNFLHSVKLSDLVKAVQGRWESTVEAENLWLDYCCQRQIVK